MLTRGEIKNILEILFALFSSAKQDKASFTVVDMTD